MGGGHHHSEFKIPDWRMYKVENCKELVEVEQALGRIGLKDPWLRNEAWRYDPAIHKIGKNKRLMISLFRGLPLGIGLVVATIAAEKAFRVNYHDPRGIHGDHGHGHAEEEHH